MKILELRFKHLNSLYGEWTIDFTAAEYVSDRIFAITGPTGAGKSTLLDAVCLALYGRTPRLKSITKSSNEIMSRQTGECFAEVTFETRAGKFRCHWSQRKAYQKATGSLLDSKHEISDADSGRILESKKREVAAKIEHITGMDFDQFTRSMLLAQGGFAAFLAAPPDQRSPILEQMTGTGIYSDISKQVHERKTDEHNRLDLLLAQTAGITLLTDEEESLVHEELAGKQAAEKTLNAKKDELEKSILRLEGIETLKSELLAIDKESEALSADLTAFEADRKRLHKARSAAALDSSYATVVSMRQQQRRDVKALADAQARLPDREKMLAKRQTSLQTAEAEIIKVKAEQKTGLARIKEVRALDVLVSEKQSAVKMGVSDGHALKKRLSEEKARRQTAMADRVSAEKALSRVEACLSANARDAGLGTQLTGITEQIENLQAALTQISALKGRVSDGKKQLEIDIGQHRQQAAIYGNLKDTHGVSRKQVIQATQALERLLGDRLLREYRAEHDGLFREMAYLRKIESLEQERAKLEDGKPCPLCGSLDHPFAGGNVPKTDAVEEKINKLSGLIRKAEHLEKEIKDHESREKAAALKLAEADKRLVQVLHRQEDSRANVLRAETELETASKQGANLKHKLALNLEPFGMGRITEMDPADVLTSLQIRWKNRQDHEKKKMAIEKKNNDLAAMISSLDARVKSLEESMAEKQNVLDRHQKDLERVTLERNRLYGRKNPDEEEARLEALVVKAEGSAKTARQGRDDISRQCDELTTRIRALKEGMAVRQPELDDLESSFAVQCKKAGFDDEPAFVAHRLSVDERNRLMQRAAELDEKQTDIAARKKDRETRLSLETAGKITAVPLDHLKMEQAQTRESLKLLGEEIGAVKQKLSDNTLARGRLQQKQVMIDHQATECARWDALHALIGSADGKKYRNFAQGLTFEVMVSHANRQLEKMTDRYLLVRDEKQPLELNIMDNYQAGEIRSTKNLSGGESFIVSLSLALGLSHMAGRNVRVDSLFLDEGFGTLDEDALETALDALSGLQQDGKLIGIISHVSALKERIGTRISVRPVSGGRSTITGPGCRAIH